MRWGFSTRGCGCATQGTPAEAASFYLRIRPKLSGGSKCLLERRNRLEKAIKASDFPGLDLVPADFSLRSLVLELNGLNNPLARIARLLRPLRNDYDLVLIDCAPGVSLVSEAVMRASDLVLVPTIPTTLSLCTYALLVDHAKAKTLDAPLVPFFSMADRRWRLHREIMNAGRAPASLEITAYYVSPYSADVQAMFDAGANRVVVKRDVTVTTARGMEDDLERLAERLL